MNLPIRPSLALIVLLTCQPVQVRAQIDESLMARAHRLAQSSIIIDGHIDVPYRLRNTWEDISGPAPRGEFDHPRAIQGGLNAPFMSIYIPSEHETRGIARKTADELLDMMDSIAARHPHKFAVAYSPADVMQHHRERRVSFLYGMENGAPIEGRLENLKYFYDRGVRYITLTHAKDNHICDSSYDTTRTWKGLSPFGGRVVKEMNRLGILVDVSHISDDAFFQVLAVTTAPVIASHSSCRMYTPGWERNMGDAMIKALAKNGGVLMINFGSDFISDAFRKASQARRNTIRRDLKARKIDEHSREGRAFEAEYEREHPLPFADVTDVADHIDHAVKLAGVDHVGLGSDYDGVGDSLPTGLKDVSTYPNLLYELLRRGYSDEEIRKICGENLLRVWRQVIDVANNMQK